MNILDFLDYDLLTEVACTLGAHPSGVMARFRLAMTCTFLRGLSLLVDRRTNFLHIDFGNLIATLTYNQLRTPIYDLLTGRIHRIDNADAVYFEYPEPPCPGAKWYIPEQRIVWESLVSPGLLLSIENYDDTSWHRSVVRDTHNSFRVPTLIESDMRKMLSNAGSDLHTTSCGPISAETLRSFERLLHKLVEQASPVTKVVNINGDAAIPPGYLMTFPAPSQTLRELTLCAVPLDVTSLCRIATMTQLVRIDLTKSVVYESDTVAFAFANLLQAWENFEKERSSNSSDIHTRDLILDFSFLTHMQMVCIVQRVRHWKAFESGDEEVFWNDFVFLAVHSFQGGASPFTRSLVSELYVSLPASFGYKSPMRERDRHMMLWYDFTCPSCGALWTRNSVTVSFKETVASECKRGKRRCPERSEYHRTSAGETFINRNERLTPPPQIVLWAEQDGLLVGINPETRKYEFFRADPDNPGRKVTVACAVASEV